MTERPIELTADYLEMRPRVKQSSCGNPTGIKKLVRVMRSKGEIAGVLQFLVLRGNRTNVNYLCSLIKRTTPATAASWKLLNLIFIQKIRGTHFKTSIPTCLYRYPAITSMKYYDANGSNPECLHYHKWLQTKCIPKPSLLTRQRLKCSFERQLVGPLSSYKSRLHPILSQSGPLRYQRHKASLRRSSLSPAPSLLGHQHLV